jgi:hypothetical protein
MVSSMVVLVSPVLSSTIRSIGGNTFRNCYGFTGSLTIPSSITTIGNSAFWNCSGFTGSLTIPSSVSSIGAQAFQGCSGFTSAVTFPNSVTTLGTNAFTSNLCNWIACCNSCTISGAEMCLCDWPSCSGVCTSTFFQHSNLQCFQVHLHPSLPVTLWSLQSTPLPLQEVILSLVSVSGLVIKLS